MKFKEYLENLNKFAKEKPQSLDFDVVTSSDDEGNSFNAVHYPPSLGVSDDGDFIDLENLKDYGYSESDVNSICVN